jgi:uncharacterized protein YkwD
MEAAHGAEGPPPTPPAEEAASSVGPLQFDPAAGPFMLAPEYSGCGGVTPPGVVNAAWEQEVLDRVNTERLNNVTPLPPLKRVTLLDGAARYHSLDMLQDNYFSHDTYDGYGGTSFICGWSSRISSFYSNWNYIGENIAAGYSSPAAVMTGWMNSSGHRENILRPGFWEIGIGYYNGGSYGHYWTQDFGRRNGQYPLVINRDAASTTNRTVNIYLYGDFNEMSLELDSNGQGAWQPFQNSFSVTLPCLSGTRKVTAKMRDYDGGTEYTSFDTIGLTATNCAVLGGLPNSVAFMYSKDTPGTLTPASLTFTPVNTASSIVMNWSVSESITWLSVSGATGSTPNSSFTLTPVDYAGLGPGTHSGNVSVTVTNPADAQGSPKVITVTMTVVADPFRYLYMPYIRR